MAPATRCKESLCCRCCFAFCCHPRRRSAVALVPLFTCHNKTGAPSIAPFAMSGMQSARSATTPLSLPFSLNHKKNVISTEAAHVFCEPRSGEIRFSTSTPSQPPHRFFVFLPLFLLSYIYFSASSAQKSHVEPLNHLNLGRSTTAAWHFS